MNSQPLSSGNSHNPTRNTLLRGKKKVATVNQTIPSNAKPLTNGKQWRKKVIVARGKD
jgi:hypothetical protein